MEGGRVKDKEVILVKPYEELTTTSKIIKSSFIHEEIENLKQYMKFIHSLTQIRLFKPPLHYTSLWSREDQDQEFWKEVAITFMDKKHNMETLWNNYPITIY